MGALIALGILAMILIFSPIRDFLTLRYYYTQEEIKRQDLRVVSYQGRRFPHTVVFSNGDRKRYELTPQLMDVCLAASMVGAFTWLAYFTRPAKIYDDETDTKADTS
jgi:hypothetical protein